jgi:hypothetical protein
MGLLDDIQAESHSGPEQCSVAALIESLTGTDRTDLTAALADPSIPHTAITRALNKRGHNMHEKRVAAHRRGDCACAR